MNLNFRNHLVLCFVASLISILTSCAPTPTSTPYFPTPTAPLQPTKAEPATTDKEFSFFRAGLSYSDAPDDVPVSFLDVIAFQAAVYEEAEILEVVLRMRDIPPTALLGQTKNFIEYAWTVYIYLDPATSSLTDIQEDYYFGVNTSPTDPVASGNADNPVPLPGEPESVPIQQILQNTGVYDSFGVSRINLDAVADSNTDTLTLRGASA